MQYARTSESRFPLELIEVLNSACEETAEEDASLQDSEPHVYIVVHEKQRSRDELEFIIEGVCHRLSSATDQMMEIFDTQYPDYPRSCFYAQGTWQLIGENSVGWYVSRNGTLSLEIHDHQGNTSRVYAEKHYIE